VLRYFVQAADGAGNVALGANKGLLFETSSDKTFFLPLMLKDY
jgi:hypothetical protein